MPDPLVIIDTDPTGIVATHPPRVALPILAAPVPDEQKGKNFNTARQHLIAIGCMRLPNRGFAFDSSIISPQSEGRFTKFAQLMQALRDRDEADPKRFPPCAVFGHADPTGKDDYNKTLSGRRALALYGVLTRKVEIWDELFLNSFGGDYWGTKAIQTMLSISLKSGEDPFYTGPVDGAKTAETKKLTSDAVDQWKQKRQIGSGAGLDATQRHQLFNEYMDAICHDANGERFVLEPTDFIAKGKGGKSLKGDVQGCGEYNPIFLLSKAKEDLAAKDETLAAVRNDLYEVDRRALVFIFEHGTEVNPKKWPCPAAREGGQGCKVRFWSDADHRRKETDDDRTFGENMAFLTVDENNVITPTPIEQTGNTMACRFYQAFAQNSPCEAKLKEWVIRFKVPTFNGKTQVLSNRRYVVKAGESASSPVIRGTTDEFGVVRIPMFDEQTSMTIWLDAGRDLTPEDDNPPKDDQPVDETKFLPFVLDCGALKPRDTDNDLAAKQRLYNLGLGEHAPAAWTDNEFANALSQFRHRNNLDNAPDDDVRRAIMKQHDLVGIPAPPSDDDSTNSDASSH